MNNTVIGNYLRPYRRRYGLSQRDLGLLVGYSNKWEVSRHERSKTVPPLLVALAYEVVFQVPIAELFTGFQSAATDVVERNAEELKAVLETRIEKRRRKVIPQKLQWLRERQVMQS